MASVDRIDSIYDVAAIKAEHDNVKKYVRDSIDDIKKAREQSIQLNVNSKSFDDYNKKIKELETTLAKMQKSTDNATKSSILLAKQKEAEAKALLASQRAAQNATKEFERATDRTNKAGKAASEAARPYKQLQAAFLGAAKTAQDLAVQYGRLDPRAQAAAKRANQLNEELKKIDKTLGNHQREVGNYGSALEGTGNRLKAFGLQLLAIAGLGSIFQSSIDEFVEMDKNVRILQNTLRNLGVPEVFGRIEASANRLAKQFAYLDNDDILKTFNQLIIYGKLTEDQINELIPVIIDFAAATGQDLNSATSVIIKALEGNGKALKEFGINIKDAKSTSEAFGLIMTELAPKVAGVGKAFGDSAAGGLAASQQRFKDLKEEIGGGLLPVLNSVLSTLLAIVKGAFGAGKALKDAFSGEKSFVASILESSDNKDVTFEAEQVFKQQMSILKNQQKILKERQAQGKLLNKTENDLNDEFLKGLRTRLSERQKAYDSIKQGTNKQAIMSAIADIRGLQRALDELDKGTGITPTGDANKKFTTGAGSTKKAKVDNSRFELLKANIELDKEFDQKRLDNEKLSYEERTAALISFGQDSQRLIELQSEHDLENAELTAGERVKIENDKNNALIRLSQDLADKLAKLTQKTFEVDTTRIAEGIKGLPKDIQKALEDFQKVQEKAIAKHKEALDKLKQNTKEAVLNLATELEGLFFDIFINQIERQKNAVQDQIDLLEAQKQKDIEVANQTITNAQEKADAIAIIEARAAAKKQQLELRQRQLDQQKARFEKARTVAEIIQSTSLAVVNALTQVKTIGPGAIALAAVIGAIGAIQIARTIAQPIPRYKEGTQNHPGGPAIVGDGGKAEGIHLPDGTIYKSPATSTVVDLPKGTKVYKDYSNMPVVNNTNVNVIDTRLELKQGFGMVVNAIKHIPQPIIKSERAWTLAHRTGSSFRTYINTRL